MKKGTIITLSIIGAIVLFFGIITVTTYNGLVDAEEAVNKSDSNITVVLKRRADLIPNFVETVKGYSDYEQSTYTAVVEARSKVYDAVNKTNPTMEEQLTASAQLDSAIDVWVNAITEAYPELKASEQYRALQDELAGTENRIAVARRDYNDAVSEYNKSIRKFPKNIFASMFGFEEMKYFEADESVNQVPQVSFD